MFTLKEKKKMVVIATPSGEEVGLFYREPTTKEAHQYQSEAVQRKRNKVIFRHSEAAEKYGKKILLGIREGDFGAPNATGETVPISSDRQSPHYREDWRDLVEQHAGIIIIALGQHVFGGTEALDGEDEMDGEDIVQD